jgi:hypothetical protein
MPVGWVRSLVRVSMSIETTVPNNNMQQSAVSTQCFIDLTMITSLRRIERDPAA